MRIPCAAILIDATADLLTLAEIETIAPRPRESNAYEPSRSQPSGGFFRARRFTLFRCVKCKSVAR